VQRAAHGVGGVAAQLSFKLWRQCNSGLSGNTPALLYGVSFPNTDFAKYNPAYAPLPLCSTPRGGGLG